MGTSTGYQVPTGGDWTPLKTEATRFVKKGGTPKTLVSRYLNSVANSGGFGGGGGGRGGGTHQAASRVGQNIGNFFARVGTVGLAGALQEFGLGYLVGKSAMEIAAALLEELAGPANTLDDAAARAACDDLQQELLRDVKPDEVESVFVNAVNAQGLDGILSQFLGFYIYQRFVRDFYETWQQKVGQSQAANCLKDVKSYIQEALQRDMITGQVTAQNWNSGSSNQTTQTILAEVCLVFGVTL